MCRWKEWKERYEEEYVDYHWISLPDQQTILKNENQVIFSTPDRVRQRQEDNVVQIFSTHVHFFYA